MIAHTYIISPAFQDVEHGLRLEFFVVPCADTFCIQLACNPIRYGEVVTPDMREASGKVAMLALNGK